MQHIDKAQSNIPNYRSNSTRKQLISRIVIGQSPNLTLNQASLLSSGAYKGTIQSNPLTKFLQLTLRAFPYFAFGFTWTCHP